MKKVATYNNLPWLLVGDFNQILDTQDKLSSCSNHKGVESSRDTINQCGLIDIIPTGAWYTWSNNRKGCGAVWERLDRVLVSSDWLSILPDLSVECQEIAASDHSPMVVKLFNGVPRRRRPVRFEAAWLHSGACNKVVTDA